MNIPLAELEETHKSLVRQLSRYSFDSTIKLLGGLLTFPEFHANTLRLEALLHLACANCYGNRIPNRDDLIKIVGEHLVVSPLAPMEDPVEDVFIGNVGTKFGNFRVFRGIEDAGHFWLERLLRPLPEPIPEPIKKSIKQVGVILRLSEAVIERLQFARNTSGGGARSRRIVIPRWNDILSHAEALVFSHDDLRKMGIDIEDLIPFVLQPSMRKELKNQIIGHTELQRRPILQAEEGVILYSPNSVISCATRFFLERLEECGFIGVYETFLHMDQTQEWFSELRYGFGFEPESVELVPLPKNTPFAAQIVTSFDVGKYAHVLVVDGNVRATTKEYHGYDQFDEKQEEIIAKHLEDCASILRSLPNFSGGMTLISRTGTAGRGLMGQFKSPGSGWGVNFASLPDWHTLSRCEGMSALRLWRMTLQSNKAKSHGLMIQNFNGLLNLFSFWKHNGWRFMGRDLPFAHPQKYISLEIDFLRSTREDVSRLFDNHAYPSHDGTRWLQVRRKTARSFYKEDREKPIYEVPEAIEEGTLVGLIKGRFQDLWVCMTDFGENSEERSVILEIWKCVMNWLGRANPLHERATAMSVKTSIYIQVQLLELPVWANDDPPLELSMESCPLMGIDESHRVVQIGLPASFKQRFHIPQNVAEVEMIAAVLEGIEQLNHSKISEETRKQLMYELFPNSDARFFHVLTSQNLAYALTNGKSDKSILIPEENHIQCLLGLAEEISNTPSNGIVAGKDACMNYLKQAVDILWARIELQLKNFNRDSVVKKCLTSLAFLEKADEQWTMTARSQLALQRDQNEVLRIAHDQRMERDGATLANRLLIETAMYACTAESNNELNTSDHLELLANLQTLVSVANHREAISEGFMDPKINIHPNGEPEVSDSFYAQCMTPYMNAKFGESFRSSADAYESWFSGFVPTPVAEPTEESDKLEKPFAIEFGLSIDKFIGIADEFASYALASQKLILVFEDSSFRTFLTDRCSLVAEQIDRFLNRFTLPIRRGWNRDFPKGTKDYDVYPWKFRRRLSLLMRPIIQAVIGSKRHWIVYPPGVSTSVHYTLYNISVGGFPVEHFESESMRIFWGDLANSEGHKFSNDVADEFEKCGFSVRREVSMKSLHVPDSEGDLGDIDVLAWKAGSQAVFLVECKRLRDARSVSEVVDRLKEFRGEIGDSLGKHLRRVDWVVKNSERIENFIGMQLGCAKVEILLVTNRLVPMQFFEGRLNASQIVTIGTLSECLKKIK